MKINIQQMRQYDISQVQIMMQKLYDTHADMLPNLFKKGVKRDREYFESFIGATNRVIFVAVSTVGNQSIGFIKGKIIDFKGTEYLKPRTYGYVDGIFVENDFRGQLVEYKLQKALFNWFANKGVYNIEASVWDINERAKDYYNLFGYKYTKHGLHICLEG